MNHDGSTFGCGCAVASDVFYCAKEMDVLAEKDQENSSFFACFSDEWYQYEFSGAWTAIAMATVKPPGQDRVLVSVSPGGAYFEAEPKSMKEVNGSIKEATGSIRSMAPIEHVVYACGMARSVLRRKSPGSWEEIGPGTTKADDGLVSGFEDIDGFSAGDMYAVGWRGEIWRRQKDKWKRLDSPVSANLNAVCCAPNGKAYVVGDDGTMLWGRDDIWEVLKPQGLGNILDVAAFGDNIYVVTDFQILKLQGEVLVPEDNFAASDIPVTCLQLLPSEDALYSLGTKDLFRLKLGGAWERLV